MQKQKAVGFSTTRIIMLGFLLVILIGTALLMLPISHADGQHPAFVDVLFTSTSAVCVTGLLTLNTAATWSGFGQAVILVLIQIGGLGFITVSSGIFIMLNKRMNMKNRMLIQDNFNLTGLSGGVRFIKNVIKGTLVAEGVGALLYMTVFVPEYGARGIWISVFTAVSAFCNAGLDIIGTDSLCSYAANPMINFVTCALVVSGGIGFIVWCDIINTVKKCRHQGIRVFRYLSLHTKIALSATAVLITGGWLLYFIFEYSNPLTIGNMPLGDKLMASLFQSVTTRAAGFVTIPQENLTNASIIVSLPLMFIGGSPSGTAGGVKTVTAAVVVASVLSTIRNRKVVVLFGRTVTKQAVRRAISVIIVSFATLVASMLLLAAVSEADFLAVLYEAAGAATTVGFSRGLTSQLDLWGKLIIIVTMYFGRIGSISLAVAFRMKKEKQNIITYPIEDVSVG
ncbi:MAG: potassium transporter KtrB [Oscillospiraceae bacterium]|nr:potassium transporter KtrB [Oscillospiraceae bacterium]